MDKIQYTQHEMAWEDWATSVETSDLGKIKWYNFIESKIFF